jgi:hypothetical protein
MTDPLDHLLAQWTRLGAGFDTHPSSAPADLERLLLDTARHAPAMARLFIMAATWLHRYGELVARNRLARLIREELAPEHQPTLGLLLDTAQIGTHPPRFQSIIKDLPAATPPRPLFDIERSTPLLAERSRRRASELSQRWGLWCAPIEFKDDALRPARWIMQRNHDFLLRADFRGDLRSSILASLRFDKDAGASEYSLARAAGGARAQVRVSLNNLEMTGRIARTPNPAKRRTRIALARDK